MSHVLAWKMTHTAASHKRGIKVFWLSPLMLPSLFWVNSLFAHILFIQWTVDKLTPFTSIFLYVINVHSSAFKYSEPITAGSFHMDQTVSSLLCRSFAHETLSPCCALTTSSAIIAPPATSDKDSLNGKKEKWNGHVQCTPRRQQ